MFFCGQQQASYRVASACLVVMDGCRVHLLDGLAGLVVHGTRGVVVMVMAQVGRDHDQGFIATPKPFKNLADIFSAGISDNKRDHAEVIEDFLQKR